MIKCALIGYGYWGKLIEKYIQKSDIYDLKYIFSPSLKTKNKIELISVLNDKEIDTVFICTPINTHFDIVKKCIENKKNVFCEKPLCKNIKDFYELESLALRKNIFLYTDYIYSCSQSINYIKSEIKKFGKIKCIKGKIEQFGNFYKEDNVYSVLGVHLISAILYISSIDKIESLKILEKSIIRKIGSNIVNSIIRLRINKIYTIILECSLTSLEKKRIIEYEYENGIIRFDMLSNNTVKQAFFKKENDNYIKSEEKNLFFDEANNIDNVLVHFFKTKKLMNYENLNLSKNVTFILESIDKSKGEEI